MRRVLWTWRSYLNMTHGTAWLRNTSTSATYTDPVEVRKIEHKADYFKRVSAHVVDPSPQRTPVLFQAGKSPAGAFFGAKHAECIFTGGRTPESLGKKIAETREPVASHGRDLYDVKFFMQFTPIIGSTDEEARTTLEEYRKYAIPKGGLALFCGISGGVSSGSRVSIVQRSKHSANRSSHQKPGRLCYATGTPRDLGNFQAIGGSGPYVAGSRRRIADEIERWVNIADIDGMNVGHVVVPGAWEDVFDLLIPELESRGGFKDYPAPRTREFVRHSRRLEVVFNPSRDSIQVREARVDLAVEPEDAGIETRQS